jgi:hypothetical protein
MNPLLELIAAADSTDNNSVLTSTGRYFGTVSNVTEEGFDIEGVKDNSDDEGWDNVYYIPLSSVIEFNDAKVKGD